MAELSGLSKQRRFLPNLIFAGVAAASSSMPALAQLEEVVVTATRRAQSVQDVPSAITTISGEAIAEMGFDDVGDLAGHVPNLGSVQPYGEGGSPFFVMRGVGTTDYTFTQSSPIALYVNDSIRALPVLEIGHMYDIERVEVLRGPQGSLYGKNATGGAVNIITRKPGFEQEGDVTFGYGNFNRVVARGAFQTGLVDDVLAARIAISHVSDDGLIENQLPGQKNDLATDFLTGRLSLLYTPTENFEAVLRLHTYDNDTIPYSVFSDVIFPEVTGGVTREGLGFQESRSQRTDRTWESSNSGINLNVNWDISETLSLVAVASYDEAELDYGADDDGLELALDESNLYARNIEQTVLEARLVSNNDGPFNWIAGAQYTADEMDNSTIIWTLDDIALGYVDLLSSVLGTPPTGGRGFHFGNFFSQERDGWAAYIRGEYELSPTVSLRAGYRYSNDDVSVSDYDAFFGETTAEGERTLGVPLFTGESQSESFDNSSFEFGVDWQASENLLAYLSFTQGYRSGAINGQAFGSGAEITAAEPEEVDSFEAGLKAELLDSKLIVNTTVFRYEYKNQQFVIAEDGGFLFPLRNAPESEINGAEVELQYQATSDLKLSASLGLLDSEYVELEILGQSAAGNQLIGAPEVTSNLAIDWRIMDTGLGEVNLSAMGIYQSKVYFEPFEDDLLAQDSYWVVNTRLSLDAENYSASIWARNLFDEEYFIYGLDLTSTYGANYLQRGAPQTYGVEFTYRF